MPLSVCPPEWVLDRICDLSYNPATGILTHVGAGRHYGKRAGSQRIDGYRTILFSHKEFGRKQVQEHNAIYYIMAGVWPTFELDHADRDRGNNRWDNLRPATEHQQKINTTLRKDNKTGFRGVWRHGNGYRAAIRANGIQIRLGTFPTPEEAAHAYRNAALRLHDPEFMMNL